MYTVVGYDKDNDVYVEYGEYSVIQSAYQRAEELQKMIDSGELRRKDNGEPISSTTHTAYLNGVASSLPTQIKDLGKQVNDENDIVTPLSFNSKS